VGVILALGATLGAQTATGLEATDDDAATLTIYRGVTVIDGSGSAPRRGMAILVRGERIESVIADAQTEVPPEAKVIALPGRSVVPGLVNAHVHLAAPPDRRYVAALLRRELYGGVTAVRAMGDDVRAVAELAREALLFELPAPDIDYAAFFAGPNFFHDPRLRASAAGLVPGELPWMRAIGPGTDLAEAVTLARGSGARAIKLYANIGPRQARRVVTEAHRQGLEVWAHAAVFPTTPLQLADAGVDSMSHVCLIAYQAQAMPSAYHARASIDEAQFRDGVPEAVRSVFERMRDAGVLLDATLYVYQTIERMRANMPEGQGPPSYCSLDLSARLTAEAHRLGVEIVAGTDAPGPSNEQHASVLNELRLLVERAGFTPLEALRSATLNGARSLGRESEFGTIEAGKLANLVFLSADPSADIENLAVVELVLKRGRAFPRTDYVPVTAEEFGERAIGADPQPTPEH
jgi:imidazolonepropionase-like amidohydrolase